MRSQYPILPDRPTAQDIENWIRDVTRLRQLEDLPDFTNLANIFVLGRKVDRVAPTSFADVVATDTLGDWVYTSTFVYALISDAGTPKWARINANVSW